MRFDVRILDGWPSVPFSRALSSRPARAARVCVGLARLALAGPPEWRRAVTRTLVGVGRVLVEVLDEGWEAALSPNPASPEDTTIGPLHPPEPEVVAKPHAEKAWAVWM